VTELVAGSGRRISLRTLSDLYAATHGERRWPIPDGWRDWAADAAGRRAEALAELQRREAAAAEYEAEQRARLDRQKAEAEQRVREIAAEIRHRIEQHRPELLPVYDAGRARDADVRAALYAALCAELRKQGLECVPVWIGDAEQGVSPAAFVTLQRVEQAAGDLPWSADVAVHEATPSEGATDYADARVPEPRPYSWREPAYDLLVAVVTAEIGEWQIPAAVLLEQRPKQKQSEGQPADLPGE
jgi:hypothetical protein